MFPEMRALPLRPAPPLSGQQPLPPLTTTTLPPTTGRPSAEQPPTHAEQTFFVNHLGPMLLTHKLLPSLEAAAASAGTPSRVVVVSSRLERGAALASFLGDPSGASLGGACVCVCHACVCHECCQ